SSMPRAVCTPRATCRTMATSAKHHMPVSRLTRLVARDLRVKRLSVKPVTVIPRTLGLQRIRTAAAH
ncbi:hypothetical protein BGZ52_010268, partial [Haplosporangium bisporale]